MMSRADQVAALRPRYQDDLAHGWARFFSPRRTDCPWCGAARLKVRLRTRDLLQGKPGRFVLEQCQECRHIFQNPQLTPEGLEFYYRDFYDGLGEENLAALFRGHEARYRLRAEAVLPHAEPETWLDVGTGQGHFCDAARAVLPRTVFDGLDISAGVESARQRGWVRRGHRGAFAELAGELTAQYDVVSMFHYLEHSTAPEEELAAAHRVLRPGGHLLIEVPDPQCRFGGLLGRWWLPWLQPQHLHFIPVGNLRERLTGLGFTVVAEEHAAPHDPADLLAAAWLALSSLAPHKDEPWCAEAPGRARRAVRGMVLAGGVPLLTLGWLLDRLIKPVAHRAGLSNAYRLLARRDGP
ncbi:class I SAM-dependent methyltransferase [Streptomyces sp. NPDC048637]|uniref:class I SAM-dependent methyltransferase n=1 Tax=Streptomyces sp. NPDC048637 TaxID=3155636 RepID=UPI003430C449